MTQDIGQFKSPACTAISIGTPNEQPVVAGGYPRRSENVSDRTDVALVLVIDVSSSIGDNLFTLKRKGIAAALDSDELVAAIAMGANQIIASGTEMSLMTWREFSNSC